MTGIAEQRNVALRPALKRAAIDDRPFVHVRTRSQHALDLARKTCEGRAQFPDIALGRPGFDAKLRLGLAGDEIDLAAVRLDVIDHDVAVLAPPFGAIIDPYPAEQRGGIGRAVGDPPGECHGRRAEQDVPDDGMHAVGADHGVGRCGAAIGKAEADAIPRGIETNQFVAEPDAARRDDARKRRMQVAAMREQIGRAEFLLGALAKDHVELDLAGPPVPVVPGAWIERALA